MSRSKASGFVTRRSHKKILKLTKGQFLSRSKTFKRAQEAMMHSLWYAYRDRRQRRRQLRQLWIIRINAGARAQDLSYSRFMHALKLANITLDRKILADLAARDAGTFNQIVAAAKETIGTHAKTGTQPA
jgi:large subunit ribosomal protein L20